jgi:hypothetical protein
VREKVVVIVDSVVTFEIFEVGDQGVAAAFPDGIAQLFGQLQPAS